jgi:hypothetical protein
MVLECGKEDQWPVILESWNLVANSYFGLWRCVINCHAKIFKNGPLLLWNRRKVIVYAFRRLVMFILFHTHLSVYGSLKLFRMTRAIDP